MLKIFWFLWKVMLIASCAAMLVRLGELAPERRTEQLRTIGIETLRNIEGWAEWGQASLREEVPQPADAATGEDGPPAGRLTLRGAERGIPEDIRTQLRAELEPLTQSFARLRPAELTPFRPTGAVIPIDLRRQLGADVVAFDVPTLTDWWAKLRLETADSNLDPGRRRDVVKAVVSLAHLLPREIWVVDGLHVPTRDLAEALAEYNRTE